MNLFYHDYSLLTHWSPIDLAYISHDARLEPFYAYEPSIDNIPEVVRTRQNFKVDRNLLVQVLKKQYLDLGSPLPVSEDVLISENTFTITTSHQPTLFTGPLFHIYKIASVINLANDFNEKYKDQQFIPVFVVSGEDHDWKEVNHFYLFGKKYEWERNASGPCGRLSTEGIDTLIDSIAEVLRNTPHGEEIVTILRSCLENAKDYAHFHRLLIHALFGRFGLLVMNLDDPDLKKAFAPVMEKEIRERFSSKSVTPVQALLEKAGFKPQAFCRPVNLFYMTDEIRERLDPIHNGVIRVDSGISYSMEEVVDELNTHPERFSPNVILRPLYQEFILPNIAYVGGGGEIAYWLDRKEQFAISDVHYPMLIRRNSLLLLDASGKNQLSKLELDWKDLIKDVDSINNSYLRKHSQSNLDHTEELEMIRMAYAQLAAKAEKLDPTLAKAILAEESKQLKQFEQLGSRLLRTEKQQQDTQLKKIQRIREKLFPANGLQERHENFLSFYASDGPAWIDNMIRICDPWKEKFILVELAPQDAPSVAEH